MSAAIRTLLKSGENCRFVNGADPLNPSSCPITDHKLCGYFQDINTGETGPSIVVYDEQIDGPSDANNFKTIDDYALNKDANIALIQQAGLGCKRVGNKPSHFKYDSTFHPSSERSKQRTSLNPTFRTTFIVNGMSDNDAQQVGINFRNRMIQRTNPISPPTSVSPNFFATTGGIFIIILIVLAIFAPPIYFLFKKYKNPYSYSKIMRYISTLFKDDARTFFLAETGKKYISLLHKYKEGIRIRDRAWSIEYGGQSFYSLETFDTERHKIQESQFLLLDDCEKIQLFQLRGIRAGAINAVRMGLVNNESYTAEQQIPLLDQIKTGNHHSSFNDFSIRYFNENKKEFKKLALSKLQGIRGNLDNLPRFLENLKKSAMERTERETESKTNNSYIVRAKAAILECGILEEGIENDQDRLKSMVATRLRQVDQSITKLKISVNYKLFKNINKLFKQIPD